MLSGGRFEVISIGFVIALWSGSRALNVVVDTITIMYGLAGQRGILRTRALSFALYLVFLLAAVILLPAGAGRPGPGRPDRCRTGWRSSATSTGRSCCWARSCMLATLYHLAVPVRTRWRADLPGAALTLLMWLGGSALLRLVLGLSVGSTSIYGPLAAPIAVLIWLYLLSAGDAHRRGVQRQPGRGLPRLSGRAPRRDVWRREARSPVTATPRRPASQ